MRILQGYHVLPGNLSGQSFDLKTCGDSLLELHIGDKVTTTFDAFSQEDIACGGNCDYMRMLAEGLEGDGIMDLSRRFARVMERDQFGRLEGLSGYRV